jgi:hypothetical protein
MTEVNWCSFELTVQSALWVYWENPGQADTRPIRKR